MAITECICRLIGTGPGWLRRRPAPTRRASSARQRSPTLGSEPLRRGWSTPASRAPYPPHGTCRCGGPRKAASSRSRARGPGAERPLEVARAPFVPPPPFSIVTAVTGLEVTLGPRLDAGTRARAVITQTGPCLSSSCNSIDHRCHVEVDPKNSRIVTIPAEITSQRMAPAGANCTPDCASLLTSCSTSPLADGTYTFVSGAKRTSVIVPQPGVAPGTSP